jgi:hypothetical protein
MVQWPSLYVLNVMPLLRASPLPQDRTQTDTAYPFSCHNPVYMTKGRHQP